MTANLWGDGWLTSEESNFWKSPSYLNPCLNTLVQVAVHNSCPDVLLYVLVVNWFGQANFFYKTLFAEIADFSSKLQEMIYSGDSK